MTTLLNKTKMLAKLLVFLPLNWVPHATFVFSSSTKQDDFESWASYEKKSHKALSLFLPVSDLDRLIFKLTDLNYCFLIFLFSCRKTVSNFQTKNSKQNRNRKVEETVQSCRLKVDRGYSFFYFSFHFFLQL